MRALLVGLPDAGVVGAGEWPQWLRIVIANEAERPSCRGRPVHGHGRREVVLVDLPVFGRPAHPMSPGAKITYIATGEGWLYLASVLDLGPRRLLR
jgi:hypothetical protein